MRFEAGMRGIDIDKPPGEVDQAVQPMLFDDPKNYEKLSEEEREERTKKMMGYHRGWVRESALRGK